MNNKDRITLETIIQDNRKGQPDPQYEESVMALKGNLELANNILTAVLETNHDFMIFGLDTQYRYLSFNNRHREMMEAKSGQTIEIGTKILNLMESFDEREAMQAFCDRALAGEQFVSLEEYIDNEQAIVLGKNYWSPIRDNNDKVIGLVCFIQDISEKEKALKEMLNGEGAEDKAESMSYRDKLTGIYNRKFFDEEIKRMEIPCNFPLSVIIMEVEGLRKVNSLFGRAYGDDLIMRVASILDSGCRGDDVVARFEENQFAIIMPKTEGAKVELAIARIRRMLEEVKVKSMKIMFAFGFGTKYEDDETLADIFMQAERLLEKEKELL